MATVPPKWLIPFGTSIDDNNLLLYSHYVEQVLAVMSLSCLPPLRTQAHTQPLPSVVKSGSSPGEGGVCAPERVGAERVWPRLAAV